MRTEFKDDFTRIADCAGWADACYRGLCEHNTAGTVDDQVLARVQDTLRLIADNLWTVVSPPAPSWPRPRSTREN